MKALQRFEKILPAVLEKIQDEISTLIGEELLLTLQAGTVVSKEEFFDQPLGKQICAKMDITGEIEGTGGLFVSVKDAIKLGGTLIMLPPAELEEVIGEERYEGETEDSYGEIANIIAGSYTKVFEEMYPKACRFIRKEQHLIVPLKVTASSEEPIPDQLYYQVQMDMQLEGKKLGAMSMLVPALPFGLAPPPAATQSVPEGEVVAEEQDTQLNSAAAPESEEVLPEAAGSDESVPDTAAESDAQAFDDLETPADQEKHKKRVDSLLAACQEKISEEVGALLGVEVICSNLDNRLIGKEDFFYDEASGKQVLADMEVVGDCKDSSYLFIGLKDAIRIGCILIMLPPNELEISVSEEEFSADSQDAYGEIANIISGVYTAVFEEQYIKSIRFIKKGIEQVVPMKVDLSSDQPIPDVTYYMSSMRLTIDGNECGNLRMLFPARLLGIKEPPQEAPAELDQEITAAASSVAGTVQPGGSASVIERAPLTAGEEGSREVLIISDSETDAQLIREVLGEYQLSYQQISFRDTFRDHLPGTYKAVFLVMSSVDEGSFGVAIKVSSCCSLPLIAAGAEWTRSKVIRAVKYGVSDILLTPASGADVAEKIKSNIVKLAA